MGSPVATLFRIALVKVHLESKSSSNPNLSMLGECARMTRLLTFLLLFLLPLLWAGTSSEHHSVGEPIRMEWNEGDLAGMASVFDPDSQERIGFVVYRQTVRDGILSTVRVTHYLDGSSEEDHARARVGRYLESLGGRSVIRDTDGNPLVDMTIDVGQRRIRGNWVNGGSRVEYDEQAALTPGTYWGPLIFIVIKNFDVNALDGRLVFRTIAPTPKPRLLDLELVDRGPVALRRLGAELDTVRIELRPTMHWMIDPVIRLFVPSGNFLLMQSEPPGLARFSGPRNFKRQKIVIE